MNRNKDKPQNQPPKTNTVEHLIKDLNISLQEYLAALKAVSVK